jgi:hypothetical protein
MALCDFLEIKYRFAMKNEMFKDELFRYTLLVCSLFKVIFRTYFDKLNMTLRTVSLSLSKVLRLS